MNDKINFDNMSIEEMEQIKDDLLKKYNTISASLNNKKKAEAEAKRAQLEKEKEIRRKEVDDAYNQYINLKNVFIKDYGVYTTPYIGSFLWF